MIITHIDNIPLSEYPVFQSMLSNTLARFSKWECAKYWEKRGMNYILVMKIYDKHIKAVDAVIYRDCK